MFRHDEDEQPKVTAQELLKAGMMNISMNEPEAFQMTAKLTLSEEAHWFQAGLDAAGSRHSR